MTAVHEVLSQSRRRLGIVEEPPGSNRSKVGAEFGWNGVPWCAEFVSVVLRDAGFKIPKNASAPGLRNQLRLDGWKTVFFDEATSGDVVFFNWPGTDSGIDHTGIVEGRRGDRLVTIEGNTSLGNGNDGVARRMRSRSLVAAVVRPPYHGNGKKNRPLLRFGARGPWVRTLQKKIGRIEVDGIFGPLTETRVRVYQSNHGLRVDGEVGPQTWKALMK